MTRQKLGITIVVAVTAFASGAWLLQQRAEPVGSVYQQARLFDDVLAHVADYYVDSLGEQQLYQMAIDGLLDRLGDPYSTFLQRDDFRMLSEQTSGNYGGLGIQIEVRDGWITVVSPLPDTPAERVGIQSGDRIVGLDGVSTEGWKQDQAVRELRGPAGTTAELAVRRVGVEQPITFRITRAMIHVRSVQVATMLDDRVGFIYLSTVNETSARELSTAITDLQGQGMKTLILDLRNNPGGLLDQGIAVSELFLDPGQAIVGTRGRTRQSSRSYRDGKPQAWPQLPVVVLANGYSASAAEIIAGALQDHDRAVLIGTPTFGKGLVQSLFQLTPETALKLTTARWYTPSGRTIQRPSASEEEQVAQVAAAEEGGGRDTSARRAAEVFRTDAGRLVYGGGGIRPDLFVAADTLTTAERSFARGLGGKYPVFRDVLTSYALELKGSNRLRDAAFPVTDAMVDEVLRRLQGRGVEIAADLVAGARSLTGQELAYEGTRYGFGRTAELRRRMGDDPQIQQALTLARRARTPQELLALAAAEMPAPSRN